MSKLMLFFCMIAFTFISCEKENELNSTTDAQEVSLSNKSTNEEEAFIVGRIDGNVFTLLQDESFLLENWNWNLQEYFSIDAELTTLEFFTEGGEIYLRARGVEYVSTTALSIIDDVFLTSSKPTISCTSSDCSHTTGCIPKADKKSCTECGYGLGDCLKVASAFAMFEMHLAPSDFF